MSKKNTLKEYSIGILTRMWVDIPIKAKDFNEAMEIAKSIKAWEQVNRYYIKKDAPGINDCSARVIQVCDGNFSVEV